MTWENQPLFPSELMLDFLQKEFTDRSMPEDLWNKLEMQYGERVYSEILYFLTQTHFEPPEARKHWQAIMGHQSFLRQSLGRDLGLRVALADYFINLHPTVDNPMILEISRYLTQERLSLRDELTGLYNRRYFNHILQQEIDRSRRFEEPLSLLMVDIDHFKKFNDTYGHVAGDRVLTELAGLFRETSRSIDHLTRYGGEEFAFILPRSNDREAYMAAQRHRIAVQNHCFQGDETKKLSVSIGVASCPKDAIEAWALVEKADQALYVCKRKTRNMVQNYSADQRRHRRFPITMDLLLKDLNNRNRQARGKTRNISFGGLLGESGTYFDPGVDVEIALTPNDHKMTIHLSGRCIRVEPHTTDGDNSMYGLGIRFKLTDYPDEERSLKTLIKQLTVT